MPNPLSQLLAHPEIKDQFDRVAEKYPTVRKWAGWVLKKIISNKPWLEDIDLQAFRWTFARLWRREFEDENQLFAAANEIYLEEWKKYDRLAQRRGGKKYPQAIGDILAKLSTPAR